MDRRESLQRQMLKLELPEVASIYSDQHWLSASPDANTAQAFRTLQNNHRLQPPSSDHMHRWPSTGLVFVAVEFGTDGRLNKMKVHQTPGPQVTEAVKTALEKWKLRELFDGGGQPIKTRTGLRFHFVFEDGKGRVNVANEQEQLEFGGEWGKKTCRVNFDE